MLANNVRHSVLLSFLTTRLRLAAINIEASSLSAGVVYAAPAVDMTHPIFSMLPVIRRRRAAVDVEASSRRAGVLQAAPA